MRIFSGIFDEAFFRPEMKNDSLAAYSLDVIIDQEISYSILFGRDENSGDLIFNRVCIPMCLLIARIEV